MPKFSPLQLEKLFVVTSNNVKKTFYDVPFISMSRTYLSRPTVSIKYHRDDGPAISSAYNKIWYKNGIIFREDGPAVEEGSNVKKWFDKKGSIVKVYSQSSQYYACSYYLNEKFHREDGPAYRIKDVYINYSMYYLNGRRYKKKVWKKLVKRRKQKALNKENLK